MELAVVSIMLIGVFILFYWKHCNSQRKTINVQSHPIPPTEKSTESSPTNPKQASHTHPLSSPRDATPLFPASHNIPGQDIETTPDFFTPGRRQNSRPQRKRRQKRNSKLPNKVSSHGLSPHMTMVAKKPIERKSVWAECHPDVLSCLQRIFRQDFVEGSKTLKSCRLVNRHWYKHFCESLIELTPVLRIFTIWDLPLLKKFSNLKSLTLRDKYLVSEDWLVELPVVAPQLETLACRFICHSEINAKGPFTNKGTSAVLRMKHLNHLEIAGSDFNSAANVKIISKKENLKYLDLSENDLTFQPIKALQKLPKLESLVLGGNRKIGDDSLKILNRLRSLTHLSLKSCSSISDVGVWNLSELQNLTSLDLRMCVRVGGIGFSYCTKLPLVSLNLMGCSSLTDVSLSCIADFKFLKHLDIRACPQITDSGLEFIKGMLSLRDFRFGEPTAKITNRGLMHLFHVISLRHVTLFFLHQITQSAVDDLAAIESLRKITIVQCDQIKNFAKRHPQLVVELYP